MISEIVEADDSGVARKRSRTWWILGGVGAALFALVVGGVTWGVLQYLNGGEPVTSALPDNTVAFAGVDFHPSASQTLDAIEFMSKFPGITNNLGFKPSTSNDLRKWLTGLISQDSSCTIDFNTQLGPWLGKRAAIAAAPNASGKLTPFGVVQVTDQKKAKAAFADDFGCPSTSTGPGSTPSTSGLAFVGGYLVVAEKQADATYFAKEAKSAPLTNDTDYKAMMTKVGDPGIAMAYVAPSAAAQLEKQLAQQPGMAGQTDAVKKQLDSFQGAAAVVRFDGGGSLEAKAVYVVDSSTMAQGAHSPVADLPGTTAIAFGNGYVAGTVAQPLRNSWNQVMQNDPTYQSDMRAIERQTGLKLPDDLITLFGSGWAFGVDSSLDPNVLTGQNAPSGSELPLGFRFTGDTTAITAVLRKIDALVAPSGFPLAIEPGDGVVGFSPSIQYAKKLAGSGGLGSTASYQAAVSAKPDPSGVVYVDLGTLRSWIGTLSQGDPSVTSTLDNMAPLDAAGMSSYQKGNDFYLDMRLTTK